jgi:hypothetical protein
MTEVFLYKFLNDKFFYEVKKIDPDLKKAPSVEVALNAMADDDYEMLLMQIGASTAKLKKNITSLIFSTTKIKLIFTNCLIIRLLILQILI